MIIDEVFRALLDLFAFLFSKFGFDCAAVARPGYE